MKSRKSNNKVLIIGPLPPPAGGISIHIERLSYLLKNDFIFDFIDESPFIKKDFFNIRKLNFINYLYKIKNADLLYIHSGNKMLKKGHILIGKLLGKKIIITFHGFERHKSRFSKITDKLIYCLVNRIILVNNDISKNIKLPIKKCITRNAFLPPVMKNEVSLPEYLKKIIIQAKSESKTILCSNASRLNIFNEQDLYGLDMCINLSIKLKSATVPFYLIFNVSSLQEGIDIFNKAKLKIKKYKLENNFLLINEKISFVKLIEESNIVLRTTNTDGDAVSIREAIYLNKLVIASDVVNRPSGTVIFKTRNTDDLFSKVIYSLKNLNNKCNEQYYSNQQLMNESRVFYKKLIEKELLN